MATKSMATHPSPGKTIKTILTVKYDCGFNNHLTIRGAGAKGIGANQPSQELSWHKGIPLKNIKPDEWVFESDSPLKNCEFKILINDEIFECGDNHTLKFGEHNQITPHF